MRLTFAHVREEGAKLDDVKLLEFIRALGKVSTIVYDNDMGYTSDVVDPVLTAYRMYTESRGIDVYAVTMKELDDAESEEKNENG